MSEEIKAGDCPPKGDLSLFSNGQLSSDSVGKISEHVKGCDACADTLNSMSENSGTLVSGLLSNERSSEADRDSAIKPVTDVGQSDSEKTEKDAASPVEKSEPFQIPAALKKLVNDITTTGLLSNEQVADVILARATPLLRNASEEERERFRNIELGLQHGRLLAAALEDGKTSTGLAGKRLMEFRREIAHRNVINVYWTTSKEKRYRVFE